MPRRGVPRIKARQPDEVQSVPNVNQLFQAFMDAFHARAQHLGLSEVTSGGTQRADPVDQFLNLRPPSFKGDLEIDDAKDWVYQIEKIFLLINCPEGYKVRLATFMLKGMADYWWQSVQRVHFDGKALQDISWETFLQVFYDHYFPMHIQCNKEREFLDLVQGNMSVIEYENKFLKLEKFAPHICADERRRARKFVNGLRHNIRSTMVTVMPETVARAVSIAGAVEDDQEQVIRKKKKQKVQDQVYALTKFDAHVSKAIEGNSMGELDLSKGDKLVLRGLQFHGYHGVRPEEKKLGQKFSVDVDAWLDLCNAGETDCLSHTVSYTEIYRIVKEVVEGPSLNLLESVAHRIATTTLAKYPQISAVRLQVKKPDVAVHGVIDYLGV